MAIPARNGHNGHVGRVALGHTRRLGATTAHVATKVATLVSTARTPVEPRRSGGPKGHSCTDGPKRALRAQDRQNPRRTKEVMVPLQQKLHRPPRVCTHPDPLAGPYLRHPGYTNAGLLAALPAAGSLLQQAYPCPKRKPQGAILAACCQDGPNPRRTKAEWDGGGPFLHRMAYNGHSVQEWPSRPSDLLGSTGVIRFRSGGVPAPHPGGRWPPGRSPPPQPP